VMKARPEILNHNVETVPRLFKKVQPQDRYEWAAETLSNAKKLDPEVLTKSGIMVGLGETMDEIKQVMRDQRGWNVDILTIGQYLQPSKKHLPIERYYTMEEFQELREYGLEIGFRWVESGPLVRSSYHAAEQVRSLSVVHRKLYGES
jgi:lipoic acid synthetase